jgi:hypothetical protein
MVCNGLWEEVQMDTQSAVSGRVRAWLLIKAIDPESAAATIYGSWGTQDGDEYVVIRADVVDCDYNVIVPVDAINDGVLRTVVKEIAGAEGVKTITVSKVLKHNPVPSYLAHGYVSEEEARYAEVNGLPGPDEVGRIMKKSPGDNPWG